MVGTGKYEKFIAMAEGAMGPLSFFRRIGLIVDFGFGRAFRLTTKENYFQYHFFEKNRYGRNQFVTTGKRKQFCDTCNDPKKSKIFKDKWQFIQHFREFIGRDVLNMEEASFEDFCGFARKHDKMFVKPIGGSWGKDVSVIPCGEGADLEQLYQSLSGENVLVEEVISQHPEMASFNASSLNSLRVVTFVRPDGKPVLMPGALLRTGRTGKIADNFHHNGVGALVDIDTGCVVTTGIDRVGKRYVFHPDSGKEIVGFQVPMWDRIRETVFRAAMVCPEVRYVGWDVALTDDGRILLVEGNDKADPDLGQMSDGIGKWPSYKKYMDEVLAQKR